MPIGLPTCKLCHGTGEREIITVHNGETIAFAYERCKCTYHTQWTDDDDWTTRAKSRDV